MPGTTIRSTAIKRGQSIKLSLQLDNGVASTTVQRLTLEAPKLLVGMSTEPAKTAQLVKDYPGLGVMREFGKDGSDTDSLPELPAMNCAKFVAAPQAVMHVSWKDDVEQLPSWLDLLTRPIYLTWYHEPMGDVTPSAHKLTAARVTQIVNSHKNRALVLGHGPIVTRYWLDEKGGSPTDWGYPGMTHFGVDAYQNEAAATAYWGPDKMFGLAFAKIRAAYPGVRLLVPEYGIRRISSDKTGEGRAQAIRDHIAWLGQQDDVDYVAYWNNWAEYSLTADSPEAAAYREILAAHAA
ncbi:hypothetical protein [Micromonospora sp. NPDC049240]|uniref:hypothetical protein n=1 Tax=Micromonospora sp. NPDC049240 TaxID=3155151 RepID=UPI0033FC0909